MSWAEQFRARLTQRPLGLPAWERERELPVSLARAKRYLPDVARCAGLAALYLIAGKLGVALSHGFNVVSPVWPGTGLALAARNADDEGEIPTAAPVSSERASERVVGRRSAYADRMHGPAAPRDQTNGSFDR